MNKNLPLILNRRIEESISVSLMTIGCFISKSIMNKKGILFFPYSFIKLVAIDF